LKKLILGIFFHVSMYVFQGLGGAVSLFKRRVYRGADLRHPILPDSKPGLTPEAVFSGDVDLKSQQLSAQSTGETGDLSPSDDANELGQEKCEIDLDDGEWAVLPAPSLEESLAVPASLFDEIDRDKPLDKYEDADSDDIDHLVLIVHGIGEMLQSAAPFGLAIPNLCSIVECCGFLRKNHAEVQNARFSQMYPTVESTLTAPTGRVEYLPIEWHEAFSIMSQRMSPTGPAVPSSEATSLELIRAGSRSSQVMMKDISLRTIPQMRAFANDTLMDVLYFMSAEHHDIIIDIVTKEMNVVVQKFRALTGFDGRISVIGHSLGSIITWDILANHSPTTSMDPIPADLPGAGSSSCRHCRRDDWENVSGSTTPSSGGYQTPPVPNSRSAGTDFVQPTRSSISIPKTANDLDEHEEETKGRVCDSAEFLNPAKDSSIDGLSNQLHHEGFDDPSQPHSSSKYPKLLFDVDNAFMLGSPIAVFLMVRNQRQPLSADFTLKGCPRVFNIFHPFDPGKANMDRDCLRL
jgi:hypothetical protein